MSVIAFKKANDVDDIFADPPPLTPEEQKKRRKYGQRLLRTYERIAHQSHFCDYCCHQIDPGDRYKARVVATIGRVIVYKEHLDPKCPVDPYEEERRLLEDLDKEDKKKKKKAAKAA